MPLDAHSCIKGPQNKAAEQQQHGVRKPVNEPQVTVVFNQLICCVALNLVIVEDTLQAKLSDWKHCYTLSHRHT